MAASIRAFYLRLSSPAPAELTLVYLPAIGGAALELGVRLRVRDVRG
ncbi:hypothetical protein OsI_09717 [Oryza sativa Indica Group]|nr:hypothetical protein OsI_09717 [Oryza sativa Indica Group]